MRGPLRIKYPEGLTKQSDIDIKSMSEDKPNDMNSYLQRLVKLIPGEAVTIHLTIQNVIKGVTDPPDSYKYLAFVGLFVVFVVRIFGTRIETQKSRWNIEWVAVFVAVVSYIIWVYATGGNFLGIVIDDKQKVWISVAVMVWTFIVPIFYKPKSN